MSEYPLRSAIDINGNIRVGHADSDSLSDTETHSGDESSVESENDLGRDLLSIAQPLTTHGSVPFNQFRDNQQQNGSPQQTSLSPHGGHHSTSGFPQPSRHQSMRRSTIQAGGPLLNSLQSYLCMVPHFCTLPLDELSRLHVMVREFAALDTVCEAGSVLQHVHVVANGSVEVFNTYGNSGMGHKRVGSITAPNVFGVDSVVFGQSSEFIMRAGSALTTILLIPKADFLGILTRNPTVAHSVGHKLIEHMNVFSIFQQYCRSIFAVSSAMDRQTHSTNVEGYALSMPDILDSYLKFDSIIHPLARSPEIDTNAWSYALRRLPSNITETFVLNLARSLPPHFAREIRATLEGDACSGASSIGERDASVTFVETRDRRRCAWKIGDRGNTLVLLREGFTDVIDLVTCFCIHLVESRKLRVRLQSMVSPSALDVIRQALAGIAEDEDDADLNENAEAWALPRLPLSDREQDGLVSIWPTNLLKKMFNILTHREEVVVKIDASLSKRFDIDPYLQWAITLRRQVLRSLNIDDTGTIPQDVMIDVLSSNAHSTKNLLCCFATKNRERILEWGKATRPAIVNGDWHREEDKLYFLLGDMMSTDSTLRDEYRDTLRSCGFTIVEDTSMTGLRVDVVYTAKLNEEFIDPIIRDHIAPVLAANRANNVRHFILNMDFAFGAQADGIMRALILTFGHQIRSLNVVGKTSGLCGRVGDVLYPNNIIFSKAGLGEDSADEIRNVYNQLPQELLEEMLPPNMSVHTGPIVTIPGTVLQNTQLLRYYQAIYGATGTEMEGSYFARQLEESSNLNLVRPDIVTRFAYYVSQLSLERGGIGVPMSPMEGVPPLYAIIRSMLHNMF